MQPAPRRNAKIEISIIDAAESFIRMAIYALAVLPMACLLAGPVQRRMENKRK